MPFHIEPAGAEAVCHSIHRRHVFPPARLTPQGQAVESVILVIQSRSKFGHVVIGRLLRHFQPLLLKQIFPIHQKRALAVEGQGHQFSVVGKAVSERFENIF
jgi:hypothetical protein